MSDVVIHSFGEEGCLCPFCGCRGEYDESTVNADGGFQAWCPRGHRWTASFADPQCGNCREFLEDPDAEDDSLCPKCKASQMNGSPTQPLISEHLTDLVAVRETERTMLDRLGIRYGQTISNGGWTGAKYLRAEHVAASLGLQWERKRICDFIATGMHALSYDGGYIKAPVFHGHEVKVSRSDWLTELADPTKAEEFRKHVHYWWLVAPKDVVKDDLPDGWGLMTPHGKTLRIVKQAVVNAEPEPMPARLVGSLMRATTTTEQRYLRDGE